MLFKLSVFLFILPVVICGEYEMLLSIPNKAFDGDLWMACTSQPISAGQFVVGFKPVATRGIVHHMSVHVCDETYSQDKVWGCVNPTHVCGSKGRQALFEWGRDAPGWTLPKDVGIPTGDKPRHLVLQVHMKPEMKSSASVPIDFSGIELSLQDIKPSYEVALGVYGNKGHIPAEVMGYTTDSACVWNETLTAQILAYSIHTHNLGIAVAAYIFRNGQWLEVGRGDPAYPEFVMDVAHKGMTLQPGDVLAVRCTYNNPKSHKVEFGSEHGGEMCNVYLHYGVPHEAGPDVRMMKCSADAQTFRLEDYFKTIPDKISDPTGNTDQSYYVQKYQLTKVAY